MRILILGGGTIGASIAYDLYQDHTITLVDNNSERTQQLDDKLDISVITGSASESGVLFRAGATTADLCLALTGVDEVNILGASIAKAMGTKRVAARAYASVYRDLSTFDYRNHFHIDRLLNIEQLTSMKIARTIRESGSVLIEYFAGGELELQDVVITKPSNATGIKLFDLKLSPKVRVGTIMRSAAIEIASAHDTIEVGDRITIFGMRKEVEDLKKRLEVQSAIKQRVVIAGGGEIGYQLAQILLSRGFNITIIEANENRCKFLASKLPKVTIIEGDASQKSVLEEQYLKSTDVFVACIGDDENNIMSSVEASDLGAKKVISVVERPDYAKLVQRRSQSFGITDVVVPQEVLTHQINGLLNSGPLIFRNNHLLPGTVDVIELEVGKNSLMTRQPLKDADLSKQTLIVAIIRDNSPLVPDPMFKFHEGDVVIALDNSKTTDDLLAKFHSDE